MENRTKTVPYNNDAEMYVLGSILLENGVMNQLVGKLNAEDFYNPQNSTIFKAMMNLHNNSLKIETVSVIEQLSRDNVSNLDEYKKYLIELT
jgi:replicative DNA helicase